MELTNTSTLSPDVVGTHTPDDDLSVRIVDDAFTDVSYRASNCISCSYGSCGSFGTSQVDTFCSCCSCGCDNCSSCECCDGGCFCDD